jgi:hypothetical protein
LRRIEKQLTFYINTINQAEEALDSLNISSDELKQGECEVTYSIPRDYTESELGNLDKEIHQLKFILDRFSEAVTGQFEKFEVRALSTSDYTLFLTVGLPIVLALGKSVSWILDQYKKILEIKKLSIELQKLKLPEKITAPIDTHSNEIMAKSIKELVKEIMNEVKVNYKHGKTKPEVTNGLENALNKLANRLDKGFQLTLRIEAPERREKDEDGEEITVVDPQYELAQNLANKIQYPAIIGKPILSLPETDENEMSK